MKKLNHKAIAAALAAAMALSIPMSASAAWNQNGNGTWDYTNKSGKVTGWNFINGNWYHFNNSGVMSTGWMKDGMNGKWYYLSGSGAMAKGWVKDGGKWYFTDNSGAMKTGWVKTGGKWYNLSASGAMNIGWLTIGDKTYFTNASGAMQSGVVQIDGDIYYLGEAGDGAMKTGKVEIDGKTYRFDEEGKASGALKPTPTVAFKTSTSGNPSTTTPVAPSKPSGGGGGGSGSGSGDGTVAKENAAVNSQADLDALTGKTFGIVKINASVFLNGADLSKFTAEEIVVEAGQVSRMLRSTPVLAAAFVFGASAKEVTVNTPIIVLGTVPSLNVNTSAVKITATVTSATVSQETVLTGTGTIGTMDANSDITVDGSVAVTNLSLSAAVTVNAGTGTIGTVNVNAADVTIDANVGTVNANEATEITGAVTTVFASAPVTINSGTVQNVTIPTGVTNAVITGTGTVNTVTAKAAVILSLDNPIGTVTVPSGVSGVTISGSTTITTLESGSPIKIKSTGAIATVNTTSNVEIAAGTDVKAVSVSGSNNVTIKTEATTPPTITAEDPTKVTATDKNNAPIQKDQAATKPVAGTYTFTAISSSSPESGSLVTTLNNDVLEFATPTNAANDTWTSLDKDVAVNDLAKGTYWLRTAGTPAGDDGSDEIKPSAYIVLENKGFTGFGTGVTHGDIYYTDSVATAADTWFTVGGKQYKSDNDSKILKNQWIEPETQDDDKKVYLAQDGVNAGDFGLYSVTGGEKKINGTRSFMQYSLNGSIWENCPSGLETPLTSLTVSTDVQVRIRKGMTSNGITMNAESPAITVTVKVPAPILTATVAPGTATGTTKVTATVEDDNSLKYKVSTETVATPNVGDATNELTSYESGANISDVDAATNKYLAVYEVNGSGKVVKFNLFTLTASDIKQDAADPDQADVDAEKAKYENAVTIAKDVEATTDITASLKKLKSEQSATNGITVAVAKTTDAGGYLTDTSGAITLTKQAANSAIDNTAVVTLTFTKGEATATLDVTVTIEKQDAEVVKSTTPATSNATIAKTSETQTAVEFALTSSHTNGVWNVYNVATGGNVVTGVTAAFVDGKLTLTHASNLPTSTYYVSWTDGSKPESDRLALTVGAYVAPATTAASITTSKTDGVTEVVEAIQVTEVKITQGADGDGGEFTIAGVKVTVVADATAATVATAIASAFSSDSTWTVAVKAGATDIVVFTAKAAAANVTLEITDDETSASAVTATVTDTTEGAVAVDPVEAVVEFTVAVTTAPTANETWELTLANGVVLAKTEVTFAANATASTLATAIKAKLDDASSVTTDWAVTISEATITLTQKTATNFDTVTTVTFAKKPV